ncbi:malate synthase, glyoxysoomal [Rhodopirellula sp. JC740]|uniref:Malate synthase, glyoxysoomal n=1 Tax=Rhodopirellula halodulae TaxID=2894198 RepID=A0ABS8NL17_9BACT|nr:malate synthase, glyoxysoomal [Rhodopirellula sp. JC740]MCC9644266.1 malate synthase, glyoxysoomal [Rhodopirellula sp. JC740]
MKSTATFLFACLIGAAFAPSASAQGLDDLFSASPQRDTPQRAAQRLELPPMPVASADAEEIAQPQSSPSDRQLARSSGSSAEDTATLAKQLRQARALEASRQRQARLEASYWASNPNLRPNWDSNFGQNYRNRIVYYVPVYVRAR